MTEELIRGYTQILDDSITEPKLTITNAPASGQHLTWDGANLKWQHNLSNASVLYLHDEASDTLTYKKLLPVPANDPENTISAVCNSGTGFVLMKEFITDQLGVSLLDGGLWEFNTYTVVDNATGVSQIDIRIYKRSSGGTETLLFSVTTAEINNTSPALVQTPTIQPDFSVNITDRLVVKYYGVTTSVASRTITVYYEGTSRYTHMHTPLGAVLGSFLTLNDTPDTYATFSGYALTVNDAENGVSFSASSSAPGATAKILKTSPAGGLTISTLIADTSFQSNGLATMNAGEVIVGDLNISEGLSVGSLVTNPGAGIVVSTGDIYTVVWTNYSATSTIVGWSSFTTKSIYYKKIGKLVFVQFRLEGTSDSVNTTFTLPYTQQANVRLITFARVRDNSGTRTSGIVVMNESSSTVTVYSTPAAAGWTAGGTKEVEGQFFFEATT